MQMTEVDLNSLVVRVKRLEKQNRIWKTGGLMALLVVGISLTASVTAQQRVPAVPMRATTIEAQNFLLRDARGTLMGRLAVKDGKPILELYDVAGRVTWSTNPRASGLMAIK
jgi:hypothetical protein